MLYFCYYMLVFTLGLQKRKEGRKGEKEEGKRKPVLHYGLTQVGTQPDTLPPSSFFFNYTVSSHPLGNVKSLPISVIPMHPISMLFLGFGVSLLPCVCPLWTSPYHVGSSPSFGQRHFEELHYWFLKCQQPCATVTLDEQTPGSILQVSENNMKYQKANPVEPHQIFC